MSNDATETATIATSDSAPGQTDAQAREIAQALTESNIVLIHQIITVIGLERTQAFLRETLAQEAQGGLLRKDGKRRTPGGAFFYHVRGKLPAVERRQLWNYASKKKAGASSGTKQKRSPVAAMTWDEAKQVLAEALQSIGEAKTVKLTLIGRPGKVVQQPSCVVVAMQGKAPPSLPKGLPTPPANSTITWAVFIATKQWNSVKESIIGNPEDSLIVEGYPVIDPKSGANVVLATSCKSVMQDRAARAAKQSSG